MFLSWSADLRVVWEYLHITPTSGFIDPLEEGTQVFNLDLNKGATEAIRLHVGLGYPG